MTAINKFTLCLEIYLMFRNIHVTDKSGSVFGQHGGIAAAISPKRSYKIG